MANLRSQYRRLFEGRTSSNDRALLREEAEYLEDPIPAYFTTGDLGTVEGYPINSITLYYWGTDVNLNAYIEGLKDYYGDSLVLEYLQDAVDGLKGTPEYRDWIEEIEEMGYHSAKDIETALNRVKYTESGMNQNGEVSSEADIK